MGLAAAGPNRYLNFMDYQIREAKQTDFPQLALLYEGFVDQPGRYSAGGEDSFLAVLGGSESKLLVAEAESALIGCVAFSRRSVFRYPAPICEVEELYVRPAFRRQGVARALMRAVETSDLARGAYYVFLASDAKRSAAHELYRRLGYTDYGIHFKKRCVSG